jgi:RND superfamily putative drug exporter
VPIRAFRERAFTMSVGLLVDAFVVRTLLAPSPMALVGERAGWPGTRLRAEPPEPSSGSRRGARAASLSG